MGQNATLSFRNSLRSVIPGVRGVAAFTLVEVMVALGIFAVAAVGILAVVTSFLGGSQTSWQETRAAHIARQIMVDLSTGTNGVGYLVQSTNYNNPSSRVAIDLTQTNTTQEAAYDVDGLPLAQGDPATRFKVDVRIYPETSLVTNQTSNKPDPSTLSRVEVTVTPSNAGTNGFLFLTKIALPNVTTATTP